MDTMPTRPTGNADLPGLAELLRELFGTSQNPAWVIVPVTDEMRMVVRDMLYGKGLVYVTDLARFMREIEG